MNLPYALHICGNTDLILEDMLQTGADAFELDYKTDINRIFDLCNQSVTFIGNIDPSGVLRFGTGEMVREKVTGLLHVYQASPRFIVNAGCAIPPDTPGENIRQLIHTARSNAAR